MDAVHVSDLMDSIPAQIPGRSQVIDPIDLEIFEAGQDANKSINLATKLSTYDYDCDYVYDELYCTAFDCTLVFGQK